MRIKSREARPFPHSVGAEDLSSSLCVTLPVRPAVTRVPRILNSSGSPCGAGGKDGGEMT